MTEAVLVCENHPDRETSLRCNRCEKPICSQCAVRTPVGYRCQECVRSQQSVFDTTRSLDYPIAFIVAMVGTGIGVYLVGILGIWGLFLAPVVGGGLAEVIRRVIKNRRSRRLPVIAAIGGAVGVVPHLFPIALALLSTVLGQYGLSALGSIAVASLWPIAYGFLIISTLYYRVKGIQL